MAGVAHGVGPQEATDPRTPLASLLRLRLRLAPFTSQPCKPAQEGEAHRRQARWPVDGPVGLHEKRDGRHRPSERVLARDGEAAAAWHGWPARDGAGGGVHSQPVEQRRRRREAQWAAGPGRPAAVARAVAVDAGDERGGGIAAAEADGARGAGVVDAEGDGAVDPAQDREDALHAPQQPPRRRLPPPQLLRRRRVEGEESDGREEEAGALERLARLPHLQLRKERIQKGLKALERFAKSGLNKSGLNKSGLNKRGLNKSGLNKSGINKGGLNKSA